MARKTDIRLRRSATAGNAPSTSDLNLGELALNTYDGAIFLKTHDGTSDAIAVAADARTLSIDYTNQKVGIKTASPSDDLHVSGIIRSHTSSTSKYIRVFGGNSGNFFDSYGNTLFLRPSGNTSLATQLDTSGNLFVAGNLGVGTTSPNRKLHVVGSGSTIAVKAEATDGNQSSLDLKNTEGEFRLINDGGSLFVYDQTDTAERLRINTSGDVGIGTSSPGARLQVNGSTADTSASALIVRDSGGDSLFSVRNDGRVDIPQGAFHVTNDANFNSDVNFEGGQLQYDASSNSLDFQDNIYAQFGTGNDLRIYHNGTNSFITNHTGNLEFIQNTTDGDIIFKNDDGSGGTKQYMRFDGGADVAVFAVKVKTGDSKSIVVGTNEDLQLVHDGSNSIISTGQNSTGDFIFKQFQDDGNIIFQCDNGSGGVAEYIRLDGGLVGTQFEKRVMLPDNIDLQIGTSGDMQLFHDGSNSYIEQQGTGNLIIRNTTDDADINFQSDDGSGSVATYFQLDGSQTQSKFLKNTVFLDDIKATFGTGADFGIKHDGSHTYLQNSTGHVYFQQLADDQDIIFQSDDGSGGVTQYINIDGSAGQTRFSANTLHFDNVKALFGNGSDLSIFHNGSSSIIRNDTGHLDIKNGANDADIRFMCDDGSGGEISYFLLDGSNAKTQFNRHLKIIDSMQLQIGTNPDLLLYHDGTNSFIENVTNDLVIKNTSDDIKILAEDDVVIRDIDDSTEMAKFINAGAVELYHDGSKKFETTSAGASVTGHLTISGDLTVNGTNTILNTTTLTVDDKIITVADGAANALAADESGINVAGASATVLYKQANDRWEFNKEAFTAFGFMIGTTSTDVGLMRNSSGVFDFQAQSGRSISFSNVSNGEHMRIDADGRVLIGTTTSLHGSADLQIQGAAGNYARIMLKDQDGTNQHGFIDKGGAGLDLTSQNGTSHGTLSLKSFDGTDTLTRLHINASGNVGIGTSSPENLLHLSSGSDYEVVFDHTAQEKFRLRHGSSGLYMSGPNTATLAFGVDQNHDVVMFNNSGSAYATFDGSTSRVGIGTSSPGQKLEVAGRVRATTDPTFEAYESSTKRGGVQWNASSDYLNVFAVGGNIILDSNGNHVGVGPGGMIPNQWASYTDNAATVFQVKDTSDRARIVINGGNGAHLDLVDYAGGANDKHMNIAVDGGVLKFGSLNDAGNAFVQNNILIMDLGTGAIKFNNAYTFPTSDGSAGQVLKTDGSGNLSFAADSGGGGATDEISDADNDTKIQVEESSDEDVIRMDTGGTERVQVTSNGLNVVNSGGYRIAGTEVISSSRNGTFASTVTIGSGNEAITLGKFNSGQSDITGLVGGSTFGSLITGGNNGHVVVRLKDNDVADSFSVVSGGGNFMTDSTSDTLALNVKATGDVKIAGNLELASGKDIKSPDNFALRDTARGLDRFAWSTNNFYSHGEGGYHQFNSHASGGSSFNSVRIQDGRVRIGTTSSIDSSAKIQIVGDSGSYARITMQDVDGTNQKTFFTQSGGNTNFSTQNGSAYGDFVIQGWNGSTAKIFVTVDGSADGKVGIGTTSPGRQLHVQMPNLAAGTGNGIRITDDSALMEIGLRKDGSGNRRLAIFEDGGTYPLALQEDGGNVGIGTASPSQALHVVGNGLYTGGLTVGDSAADTFVTKGHTHLATLGNNVGIGTTSPNRKFVVRDSGAQMSLLSDTDGSSVINFGDTADDNAGRIHYNNDTDAMFIRTATVDRITILSSGDVGIGTTTPDTRLDVTAAGVEGLIMNQDTGNAAVSARMFFKDQTRINGFLNVNGVLEARTGMVVGSSSGTKIVGIGPTQVEITTPVLIEEYQIDTVSTTTSSTSQAVISQSGSTVFRSCRYTVQITNSTDDTYHTTELLLVHDGTTANITEFGTIFTGAAVEATFDADISSGNIRLLATPVSTDTMVFKVVRHSITV